MSQSAERARPSFRFFPVDQPLARYVQYVFASVVPKGFIERILGARLPELEAQLVFVIEQGNTFPDSQPIGGGLSASLFLQPAHLQMFPIPGTIREAVGASLSPAGLRLLLPRGAGDLTSEPLISLEHLLGQHARTLRERLVAAQTPLARLALLRADLHERALRAERAHVSASRALYLLEAAHGDISVDAVARSCGVTSRTLRKVLLSETGMPPKQLARILRVRHALQLLRRADAPIDGVCDAFSDQAHLCREFRALLGTTPGALFRELHSPPHPMPSFTAERDLVGTGLLVLPRATPTGRTTENERQSA